MKTLQKRNTQNHAQQHRLKHYLAVPMMAISLIGLSACTANISPDSYSYRTVGSVAKIERGEIDSYRWVEVRTDKNIGKAAGIGVGLAAGSTIGDGADGVIGAIGGAILGGVLGNAIDESNGKKGAYEYVIRTIDGDLFTIVQADTRPIPKGAPVIISFGERARVRLDESRIEAAPVY